MRKTRKDGPVGEWATWKWPLIWPWRIKLRKSGGDSQISVENRERGGIPMKGIAWIKARKPLTYCKGDLARVERRGHTCREGINIWREGNRQPWKSFQSDLRKINMTALPVLKVGEGETDATPRSCSLSWTKQSSVSQMGNREDILWNWNRTDFPDLSWYVGWRRGIKPV